MKKNKKDAESPCISVISPPKSTATTMEGRENELIALAYDAAEERIRNGTASSQEIVHFLRLGSEKERMAQEEMRADIELKRAKVKAIDDSEHLEKIYNDAIEAFKKYRGDDEE